jgi:predicted CoA-binding protein
MIRRYSGVEKMATQMEALVNDFLAQKRIAVAGVSRSKPGAGNAIYKKLKQSGHVVYAIHPSADEVEGDKAYHDLKSTPEKVDGVVIATNPKNAEEVVRQAAEAGVPRVWMHESMIHGGTSVSDEAVKFCQDHNITVIAAGCPMMFDQPVDFFHKCMCWWMKRTGQFDK